MNKKYLILSFFINISISKGVEKQIYLIGGGGEPEGASTKFDYQVEGLSRFVNKKNDWKVKYNFNGGHSSTEKLLEKKFKSENNLGNFNRINTDRTLDLIKEDLLNKKKVKGDQIMIMIGSHGDRTKNGETTHSVLNVPVYDKNGLILESSYRYSMDKLIDISKLAEENGVKLAIVDFSCFSGNTIKLANKNTCVVTASGPDDYAYLEDNIAALNDPVTFSGNFLNKMKSGENLEDIYLKARKNALAQDFPMISSNAGKLANDVLYNLTKNYLKYDNKLSNVEKDFTYQYKNSNLEEIICKTKKDYEMITDKISELEDFNKISNSLLDLKSLKYALNNYRKNQVEYESLLIENNSLSDELRTILNKEFPNEASLFKDEDIYSITSLSSERDKSVKIFKSLIEKTDDLEIKKMHLRAIDRIEIKSAVAKKVLKMLNSEKSKKLVSSDKLLKYSSKMEVLAEDVSLESKKIYDRIYNANKKSTNENSMCRDFIL